MRRFFPLSSILSCSSILTLVVSAQFGIAQDRLPAATQASPVKQVVGWEGDLEIAPAPAAYDTGEYHVEAYGAGAYSGTYCPPDDCPVPVMRYDLPSKHYGIWTRPAAFAEDSANNCQSMRPFAPRGYGFPYRQACERLDYSPYQLRTVPCTHGPAYYGKTVKAPCKACLQKHH